MDATYFTGQVSRSNRYEILVPWEPEPKRTMKWCYRCRKFKPCYTVHSEFYRKAAQHDGYSGECKMCDLTVRAESRRKKKAQ